METNEKLFEEFHKSNSGDVDEDSQKLKLFNGNIILNEGISKYNYYAAQIQQVMMVLTFTMADTLQPMLLLDSGGYNVPQSNAGTVNAWILAFDLPLRILIAPLYGLLADHFGRRPLFIYATISLSIGFITAPSHDDVFPGYLFSRLLIVNGAICCLVLPFNADYVDNSTKGKAAGIAYTVGAAGALIAAILLTILQAIQFTLEEIYIIVGLLILGIGLINSIWIKGGNSYFKRENYLDAPVSNIDLRQKLRLALNDVNNDAWILIGFMLSLLGSADFYVVTTIFVLYVKSFYSPSDESIANQQATIMQGIFFAFAVLFCIIYGVIIDKRGQAKLLITILIISAIGFASFNLVGGANDFMLYVSVVIASIGLPGIFTYASFLSYKHFTPENRGILMGISAIFGVVGVVTVMIVGGFLFDTWNRNGPFILYFVLISITLIVVYRLKSNNMIV